jgi:hypothetical protein
VLDIDDVPSLARDGAGLCQVRHIIATITITTTTTTITITTITITKTLVCNKTSKQASKQISKQASR